MKYISLFILFVLTVFSSYSQISREEYIKRWQLVAIEEMNRSGIPASITMAQGCLESNNGNSDLSKKSNNHFGIKCKKGWKGKKVYYDDDAKNECFRKYRTVEDSFVDHSNFLIDNPRYGSLFKLKNTDYKGWAKGLKKAGYATARDYDKHLIRIIEENELHRLDKRMSYREMAKFEQESVSNIFSNSLSLNSTNRHEIIKFNRVKSVVSRTGDTYEMLAQELGLKTWELYRFNDQAKGYRPVANEIVYIKPKKKKASKNSITYKAQQGESMHYISQMYGIKLKPLYKRNGMKPGQQAKPGQTIYLREKKK